MVNEYSLSSDRSYYEIYFRDGSSFIIDAADFRSVSEHTWFRGKRGYPIFHTSRRDPEGHKTCTLHRFLLNPEDGYDVDHISGNKMDNRRSNLRICTHQQNMFNQKKRSTNSTGITGIYLHPYGKYEAYIHVNGGKKYIGLFDSIDAAAEARSVASDYYFGEFARQSPV